MYYFEVRKSIDVAVRTQDGEGMRAMDLWGLAEAQRVAPDGSRLPPIWEDPKWRENADAAECFFQAHDAMEAARGRRYCVMPDEAFKRFRPLITYQGLSLPPALMPIVHQVLRATTRKPDDFEAEPTNDDTPDEGTDKEDSPS